MSNFSDYIKNNSQGEKSSNNKNVNINSQLNEQNLEKLIDKYSSQSSNDLLSEFIKLTIEKKKKGELNNQELQKIKSTIVPFLSQEQKSKLDEIIELVEKM